MTPNVWWCMDCSCLTELTVHGRCGHCNSNGVAFAEGLDVFVDADVLQLELMFNQAPMQAENATT